jgi:hypothetical protein
MRARTLVYRSAVFAAAVAATTSCSDPTGVDRLAERDQNIPATIEVSPADLVIREGDTGVVRVIVRNSDGRVIQAGAPRYILNWKAASLQVTGVSGALANTFTIRGVTGGTSQVDFEVVPFASPQGSGSGLSSLVQGQPLRGSSKVKVVGTPTSIVVVSGDRQAAAPGATLPDSVTVQLLDKRGKPVVGHAVTFQIKSGGGQIGPTDATSDADGMARVSWRLGTSTGEQLLETAAADLAGPTVTAVAQPVATQVIMVAGSGQSAPAGSQLNDSLAIQVRDASNNGVAGVTVYWDVTAGGGVTAPAQSVSDANGLAKTAWTLGATSGAHSVSARVPGVGEVDFSATATTGLPPGADRVVVSPDPVTLDAINAQQKLSATVYDAANQVMSGQTVSWSSLSSGVATVDGTGLVTARAVGTALIVALSGGVADTATITVRQVPASIELNTTSVTLLVGDSQQLQATVSDAGGTAITGAAVSWTSSTPSVATVSSSGLVTAVAAGTAVVTATSGGLSTQAAVSVGSAPSTAPQSGTVALQIVGFSTGNVLVSSGIPLAPGMLMPGDIGRVRLLVGTQEQSIFVKALDGRHRDGSVRSILVQFMYNVGSSPIAAQLAIGSTRTTSDRAETLTSFTYTSPVPRAVVLPTSTTYLLSTGIVLPTVAAPSAFSYAYEDRFVEQSDGRWGLFKPAYDANTLSGDAPLTANYYDRALMHWAWWVRTGDAKYWQRAVYYLMAYREKYLRPNNYGVQPHNMMVEGLELHYLLTGDTESRRGVEVNATNMVAWLTSDYAGDRHPNTESRVHSRILLAFVTGARLGMPYQPQAKTMLDKIIAMQHADGAWRFASACEQQFNFMAGLVNEVMAKYYDVIEPDSRIPTTIGKSLEFMWTKEWRATEGAFTYLSGNIVCPDQGGPQPAPDLNMLIVHGFGWMYKRTGNSVYRTRGDVVFNEGVARAYFGSTYAQAEKHYNEQYRSSYQYLFNRM